MSIKNRMLVEQMRNAVVGNKEKREIYYQLVQNYNPVPLASMYGNKEYEDWFNEQGELYTNVVKNEIFVLSGKAADNIYILGDRLNYMEDHDIFRKLGFDNKLEYFQSDMFPYEKTTGYEAMAINYYFDREQGLALKSKARFLLPILNYLEKQDELKKKTIRVLSAKAMTLNEDALKQFANDYLRDLKQGVGKDLDEYEYEDSDEVIEVIPQTPEKKESTVNFMMPKFAVEGKTLKLQFKKKADNEIYTLALRRLSEKGVIEKEIEKMMSEPEFENYRDKIKD